MFHQHNNIIHIPSEKVELHELLSQETRHYIVQFVLAHPDHLMSLTELDYAVSVKAKASIKSQLDRLVKEGIISEYVYKPSESKRDLPAKFFGFTDTVVRTQFQQSRGESTCRTTEPVFCFVGLQSLLSRNTVYRVGEQPKD